MSPITEPACSSVTLTRRSAIGGKSVRRAPRYLGGPVFLVHFERLRMGPGVRRIQGHIEGDIPDHLDPLLRRVGQEFPPLLVKFVLLEAHQVDLFLQTGLGLLQRRRLPFPQRGLPFQPGSPAVLLLDRGEQGIIHQPEGFLLAERLIFLFLCFFLLERLERLLQHRETVLVQRPVIHPLLVLAKIQGVQILLGQQPVFHQPLRGDEVGVPGKGRKRLIGRVPVARGPHREDLPVGLPGVFQKVHKFIRLFAEAPDPVL